MSQKIVLIGIVMILAVGAGVWALAINSNQVPTVNLTATDNNTTAGNSATTAASNLNQKTSTSKNSASNGSSSSGGSSSSSGSSGSSSGGSSSGSSSSGGSSSGGWVNVVPSTDNSHSETTG